MNHSQPILANCFIFNVFVYNSSSCMQKGVLNEDSKLFIEYACVLPECTLASNLSSIFYFLILTIRLI